MATMTTTGLDEYMFSFEELSQLPDSVLQEMLQAEGEVIKEGQIKTAQRMLQGPYNQGGVVSGIKLGKFKRNAGNATMYVTFEGEQHGPFIREANETNADKAVDAAEKVYDNYLSRKGL